MVRSSPGYLTFLWSQLEFFFPILETHSLTVDNSNSFFTSRKFQSESYVFLPRGCCYISSFGRGLLLVGPRPSAADKTQKRWFRYLDLYISGWQRTYTSVYGKRTINVEFSVLGGLVGVVSLQWALWGFGGVWVCGWFLGLGSSWASWMVVVVVGSL